MSDDLSRSNNRGSSAVTPVPNQKVKSKTQNAKLQTDDSQKQATSYPPLSLDEKKAVGSLYKEAGPGGVIEQKEFTPPPEVKEYVTEVKKEEAIDLQIPIEDEFGAILMESASPQKPKIFLPLDEPGILQGLKQKVSSSVRWLVIWCLRLIKMFPQRVFYKKASSN
jgi:hypothetical protein